MDFKIDEIRKEETSYITVSFSNGNVVSFTIQNEETNEKTKSIIAKSVYNIVCNEIKNRVMEEKGYKVNHKRGAFIKNDPATEEKRAHHRELERKNYYRRKALKVSA